MKKLALLLSLSAFSIGCGGGGGPEEAMSKMKTARDKICKCADVECADKAKDEFRDWIKANRDKLKDSKPSDSFKKSYKAVEDEADACMDKLRDAAKAKEAPPAPPAPPAEPAPAAPPTP